MVFGRAKVRIMKALLSSDHAEIEKALSQIEEAIDGHQAGRPQQQGASKERLDWAAKRFHVVPNDVPKKGA